MAIWGAERTCYLCVFYRLRSCLVGDPRHPHIGPRCRTYKKNKKDKEPRKVSHNKAHL